MHDPTTQSNYLDILTHHIVLQWSIDLEARTVSGTAIHDMEVKSQAIGEIMYVSRPRSTHH